MNVVARAVILAALVVCAVAIRDEKGWDRSNNPFMRLAQQLPASGSLLEQSAQAAVLRATQLSEESSEAGAAPIGESSLESSFPTELTESSNIEASTSLPPPPPAPVTTESENSVAAAENTLSEQAHAELARISSEAEASARKTLAAASAKAKAILDKARRSGARSESSCDSGCNDEGSGNKKNSQDYMILQIPPAEVNLDERKLGLAPPMSVDTPLLKQSEKIGELADQKHEQFLDKFEADCAGSICPLANK